MKKITPALFLLFICTQSFAQLRLPAILNSGMVLQQNDSVLFWGWGYNLQNVFINASWNNKEITTTINNSGRWQIKLQTPNAGGPYTISIKSNGKENILNDVLIGEVWVCSGQSNMEWNYYNNPKTVQEDLPYCYNTQLRFFQIPRTASEGRQDDVKANWQYCDSNSLKEFSAVGYYFGKKLQQHLQVPIGLINASWGGTPTEVWTPSEEIYNNEMLKKSAEKLKEVPWCPITPGLLFNGMINPITKYNIAGAIWYQGEGNTANGETYFEGLSTMIKNWRLQWNKVFPFYFVQITPYQYGRAFEGAIVREQQLKVSEKVPNTGMISIPDLIDSVSDAHPGNKKNVGYRLANYAMAETYGHAVDAYRNPTYKSMRIQKNKIEIEVDFLLTFLTQKGDNLKGFLIAGEDKIWLPAEGIIKNNKIIVWNKNIAAPIAVRYCFDNATLGNVISAENLPLIPFRTDDWPITF